MHKQRSKRPRSPSSSDHHSTSASESDGQLSDKPPVQSIIDDIMRKNKLPVARKEAISETNTGLRSKASPRRKKTRKQQTVSKGKAKAREPHSYASEGEDETVSKRKEQPFKFGKIVIFTGGIRKKKGTYLAKGYQGAPLDDIAVGKLANRGQAVMKPFTLPREESHDPVQKLLRGEFPIIIEYLNKEARRLKAYTDHDNSTYDSLIRVALYDKTEKCYTAMMTAPFPTAWQIASWYTQAGTKRSYVSNILVLATVIEVPSDVISPPTGLLDGIVSGDEEEEVSQVMDDDSDDGIFTRLRTSHKSKPKSSIRTSIAEAKRVPCTIDITNSDDNEPGPSSRPSKRARLAESESEPEPLFFASPQGSTLYMRRTPTPPPSTQVPVPISYDSSPILCRRQPETKDWAKFL